MIAPWERRSFLVACQLGADRPAKRDDRRLVTPAILSPVRRAKRAAHNPGPVFRPCHNLTNLREALHLYADIHCLSDRLTSTLRDVNALATAEHEASGF